MTNQPSNSDFEPRFNGFLFASVGEDRSGMPLSLLSTLARLDLDPWEEAARLAALPGEAAIERLSALISPHAAGSGAPADTTANAARLIALLPPKSSLGTIAQARGKASAAIDRWWPIASVGFLALSFGATFAVATWRASPEPAAAHAQAMRAVAEAAGAPARVPTSLK